MPKSLITNPNDILPMYHGTRYEFYTDPRVLFFNPHTQQWQFGSRFGELSLEAQYNLALYREETGSRRSR